VGGGEWHVCLWGACLCSFVLSRLLLTFISDRDIKEQA
jgi:hypothetical protein